MSRGVDVACAARHERERARLNMQHISKFEKSGEEVAQKTKEKKWIGDTT
jgi:hypothetical protein